MGLGWGHWKSILRGRGGRVHLGTSPSFLFEKHLREDLFMILEHAGQQSELSFLPFSAIVCNSDYCFDHWRGCWEGLIDLSGILLYWTHLVASLDIQGKRVLTLIIKNKWKMIRPFRTDFFELGGICRRCRFILPIMVPLLAIGCSLLWWLAGHKTRRL